ncbi:MAG: hypothetical protein ABI308_02865 [Mucilaginibacter sp.]
MKYLFTLLFLLPAISFAQSNYKPGYIINLHGDTVTGYIDYKEWISNPNRVSFKNTANTTPQMYTPTNVNGFGITGLDTYQTYKGKISLDKVDLSHLLSHIDTTSVLDTVFLRILNNGRFLTLLEYKDDIKVRYFIAKKGEQPDELIYHVYINDTGSSDKEVVDAKYQKQLQILRTIYAPADLGLIDVIQTTKYEGRNLAKTVAKLNGENASAQTVGVSHLKKKFFIGGGVSNTITNLNPNIYGGQTGANTNASTRNVYTAPVIYAGMDLILNKYTSKMVYRTELSFTYNQARFNYVDDKLSSTTLTQTFMFDQKIIAVTPQLLYNFYSEDKFKLYASIGLAVNYSIYSNKRYYRTSSLLGTADYDYDFKNTCLPFFLNPVIKAGVLISNKIEVNAGYLFSTVGMLGPAKIGAYRAGINYMFK